MKAEPDKGVKAKTGRPSSLSKAGEAQVKRGDILRLTTRNEEDRPFPVPLAQEINEASQKGTSADSNELPEEAISLAQLLEEEAHPAGESQTPRMQSASELPAVDNMEL